MDSAQVLNACQVLLTSFKTDDSSKLILSAHDQTIWLQVNTHAMPAKMIMNPIRIPLTHPIYSAPEVCLFTKDPQRFFKDKVAELSLPIARVIEVTKLKAKFNSYEAKRVLCDQYELFLADERVLPKMPQLLGKYFFEKKRYPMAIDLTRNIAKEFNAIISGTALHLNHGNTNSIKIGKVDFTPAQLHENITNAIEAIVAKIPGKWANVQTVLVKTAASMSLPIYISTAAVGEQKPVEETTPVKKGKKAAKVVEVEAIVQMVEVVTPVAVASPVKKQRGSKKPKTVAAVDIQDINEMEPMFTAAEIAENDKETVPEVIVKGINDKPKKSKKRVAVVESVAEVAKEAVVSEKKPKKAKKTKIVA